MSSTTGLEKRAPQVDGTLTLSMPLENQSSPRRILHWLALFSASLLLVAYGQTVFCRRPFSANRDNVSDDAVQEEVRYNTPSSQAQIGKLHSIKRQDVVSSAAAATQTVLECFQVSQPVLTRRGPLYHSTEDGGPVVLTDDAGPSPKESCTILLMEHSFGSSYGVPFIGKLGYSLPKPDTMVLFMNFVSYTTHIGSYTPPNCQFNRVVINFTVTSQGRQYDRLALMYLGDTEVWRTSTAEPKPPPGIRWEYWKDMTEFLYFWKSPQKLIFDLGNLINEKYTGSFNTTLTATFFMSDVETDSAPPSDLIIPVTKRQSATNSVSHFTLPLENATNTINFPRNARRAVFSVSANGQATEEFWWSNVLQSDVYAFNSTIGPLPGLSPFREVLVLIDGKVAGVQWPFPVIFTGGVSPGLHRPIVGIQAFDLREHEIDITPFLPLLCDGAQHTFTIQVAGIDDTGSASAEVTQTVGHSWYVTGKIFIWLDEEGSITTGEVPSIQCNPPAITLSRKSGQTSNGTNETLTYDTHVQRKIVTSAKVVTQKSSSIVSWSQTLSYSNKGHISGFGFTQINNFSITGTDKSSGSTPYRTEYHYPLHANTTFSVSDQGNLTIRAHLVQGLELLVVGASVFPPGLEAFTVGKRFAGGAQLRTTKEGTAFFHQTGDGKNSTGFGTSNQVFLLSGLGAALYDTPGVELYFRNVTAVNGTIVHDEERAAGAAVAVTPATEAGGNPPLRQVHQDTFVQAPDGPGRGGPNRVFMGRAGIKKTEVTEDEKTKPLAGIGETPIRPWAPN